MLKDRIIGGCFLAFALAVLVSFIFGCAGSNWNPPDECVGQPSLIMEKIPDPGAADMILQLANLEMVRHDVYTVDAALAVLDEIDGLLDKNTTYADLVSRVLSRFADFQHDYGVEILLASHYLLVLDEPLPISGCDRILLRAHIKHQRSILEMAR